MGSLCPYLYSSAIGDGFRTGQTVYESYTYSKLNSLKTIYICLLKNADAIFLNPYCSWQIIGA